MSNRPSNHSYGFAIDPFRMDSQEAKSEMAVKALLLRELWTHHLINEENQLNEVERRRRPLQAEFASRNFF